MSKQTTPGGFYNHSQRPVVSHQVSTSTGRTSTGRRHVNIQRQTLHPPPPVATTSDIYNPMDVDLPDLIPMDDSDDDNDDNAEVEIPGVRVKARARAKRYNNSDNPLQTWVNYRDEYLDECMALEGRGEYALKCTGCTTGSPDYRCRDCIYGAVYCQSCILTIHERSPLHAIESWNGSHFERTSLQALGLRVQLGHAPHRKCSAKVAGHKHFAVIHSNGIHRVSINYCHCRATAVDHWRQLLRIGWWPATPGEPQTCSTLEVLQHYHMLNLRGKLAAHGFYEALELQTCNNGLQDVLDREEAFLLTIREYRHVKMGKRAGRAYDPTRLSGTLPGALVVPCRACPIPGVNLPQGWDTVEPHKEWLYRLILGMDANFRLKNRLRTTTKLDTTLGPGWAYFVQQAPYVDYIKNYVDQEEIRTCVGFQALLGMLTKRSKGLRATGMAAVSCARHEFFRAHGIGDLQKGERQCNMDYVFASSIAGAGIKSLIISYDVACQWFVHFWRRMKSLPPHLQIQVPQSSVRALVPKFHLQTHVDDCHGPYAFNFTVGAGRTDGEGVERNWASLNRQAASTSEMTAGSRTDTLDDCCGHANWRKVVGTGDLFLVRMLKSIKVAWRSRRDFLHFDKCLRQEHEPQVLEWEHNLIAWQSDRSLPDPYRIPASKISLARTRLELAEEEKARVEQGRGVSYGVSASAFILLGMEIQGTQETLRREVKGKKKQTLLQTSSLVERRTTLIKRVMKFREIQQLHMPGVDPTYISSLRRPSTTHQSRAEKNHIENNILYLPSDLTGTQRRQYCLPGLADIEDRLRFAEANDALESLRYQLRTRSFTNDFKIKNITGQKDNTRSREKQNVVDDRIKSFQNQYNRARDALVVLRGPGEWEEELRVLEASDVRTLNERGLTELEKLEERAVRVAAGLDASDDEDIDDMRVAAKPVEVGEGHRRPSWIWYSTSGSMDMTDPAMRDALRVEWAKSKARADRWKEEIMLLEEEMRRVIEYCQWRSEWWRCQCGHRDGLRAPLLEGLSAYAEEQASQEAAIANAFTRQWAVAREQARRFLEELPNDGFGGNEVPLVIEVAVGDEDDENLDDSDNDVD